MLRIFNTLTNKKELFKSIVNNKVNIYVCGVTVSDYCHLGHGRTFYFFDILLKYLIHLGYKCRYIRNITDIDDFLVKKANKSNVSVDDFLIHMINSMWNDFNSLGFKKPNYEPRISNYIKLIIENILFLLKNKFAYISLSGDVIFSIKNNYNYGNIFLNLNKNCLYKKNFVLWKLNNDNDFIGWKSPWGFGRPGWHIGCSTISNKFLFNSIDIHGGGLDLKFPHHENEIIQSRCLFGKECLPNYWMHTGMVINSIGKLSKSHENTFLISNLLKIYHSDVIKFFFMSKHYRKNLFFDINKLEKYKLCLNKFYSVFVNFNLNLTLSYKDLLSLKEFDDIFYKFINDDFNISGIYVLLFDMLNEINKIKNKKFLLSNKLAIKMRNLANLIGLLEDTPSNYFNNYFLVNKNKLYLIDKINFLVKLRNLARRKKDWKTADALRNKLFKLNVNLKDKENYITEWYIN